DDVDTAAPTRNAGVPRPRIVIDGVFWQYLSSGIGRVWENVLREWVKTGFIDNVILLDRAGTAPRIHGVHYWTIAKHDYAQTGRDSLYLEQVCRQLGADLFVSTYYSTPTTTPSFFSGYDMIPEVLGFPLAAEAWQEKRRAILHAAGHSMISRNSANDLERVYPELPRGRTHVVLVAADANFKPPGEGEIRAFKTKHGLADRRYVLMVGERFGHGGYKNGALAFRAAAMLPKDKSFTLVCIGGQAEIEQQLRSLAPSLDVRRLSLSDDELRAAYGGAHALLYPSKYEGFGMPPLESMACGTPAIVCNNSSLPEVVGDAAIFVSDGDPGEMRDALLRLVEPDVRNDLIQRGLQQAGRFTFGKMAIELSNALVSTHKRLAEGAALRPSAIWTEFRTLQQELQAGSDRSVAAPSILTADLENIRSLLDRATLKARRVAGKLLRRTGLRQ
ncbi:MAG: glycosyltransferase family 1 protein, partial [Hyphomicrobium sp.]|nr:glycosyltransferase family 1 protein [Hyphomicrobium sp.]